MAIFFVAVSAKTIDICRQMNNVIKFVISGCGHIALRHATASAHFGELIAVCDADISKTKKFAEWFDCNTYNSIDEMLRNEADADVVSICTPNYLHCPQSILSLEKGFHVICEKPMAINISDAKKMISASQSAGRELFVVKQMRYYPLIAYLKKLIDERSLGKIFSIHINCFWNRGVDYYHDWKGSKEKDGGTLFTQFSHYVDLLIWLFGKVNHTKFISANLAHPEIEFEDTGVVSFEMESGAIGNLSYSVNTYDRNIENSVSIIAEKGSIKINGAMLDHFEYFKVKGIEAPPIFENGFVNKEHSHFKVYENVANALNGSTHSILKASESIESIELIEGIYNSGIKF